MHELFAKYQRLNDANQTLKAGGLLTSIQLTAQHEGEHNAKDMLKKTRELAAKVASGEISVS
jgi:hypothetical protein